MPQKRKRGIDDGKEAQAYTEECFNAADNIESIYINDWDAVTLTHPNKTPML